MSVFAVLAGMTLALKLFSNDKGFTSNNNKNRPVFIKKLYKNFIYYIKKILCMQYCISSVIWNLKTEHHL